MIDNIIGATVVTSASEILEVSEEKIPDLFWAIRGGGGNFGVVTEFVFRLHPQRDTVFHHCTSPPAQFLSNSDKPNNSLCVFPQVITPTGGRDQFLDEIQECEREWIVGICFMPRAKGELPRMFKRM